jgi:hypothetical protein
MKKHFKNLNYYHKRILSSWKWKKKKWLTLNEMSFKKGCAFDSDGRRKFECKESLFRSFSNEGKELELSHTSRFLI